MALKQQAHQLRFPSFPSSGLGTASWESKLELLHSCVPKLELGNKKQFKYLTINTLFCGPVLSENCFAMFGPWKRDDEKAIGHHVPPQGAFRQGSGSGMRAWQRMSRLPRTYSRASRPRLPEA